MNIPESPFSYDIIASQVKGSRKLLCKTSLLNSCKKKPCTSMNLSSQPTTSQLIETGESHRPATLEYTTKHQKQEIPCIKQTGGSNSKAACVRRCRLWSVGYNLGYIYQAPKPIFLVFFWHVAIWGSLHCEWGHGGMTHMVHIHTEK